MSKNFKKNFATLKKVVKRERMLVISNIVMISTTFLILGIFLSIVIGTNTEVKYLEEQAQVAAFFEDDFTEDKILTIKTELEKDERIAEVKYVSKEEAVKIFSEDNKDEPILLEALTDDVLPASLEIKTNKIKDLATFATQLEEYEGVNDVRYFKDVVDTFKYWATVVYIVGGVLVAVFVWISFSLIISTLRASIDMKGKEIGVMKLVGATDLYIKSPLIFQGVYFSALSASIATVILLVIYLALHFTGVLSLTTPVVLIFGLKVALWIWFLILFIILVALGSLLGYFGSLTAIKRHLKY